MTPDLTHIWLLVDDMPRALHFYRDTLGLEVANNLGQYVELKASGGFMLALFERAAHQAGEPAIALSPVSGQRTTLAFEVESPDAVYASLREKGVEFASVPTNQADWGLRTVFLRDPDGNLLCLYGGIPA
jgi:catechol 2,3-dioxygenase-like lactoylglutathione lyase family enzyme